MTPFEILQEYKSAKKNPRAQLRILADENDVPVPEIRRILIEQGVDARELHAPLKPKKDAVDSDTVLTADRILADVRSLLDALLAERTAITERLAEIDDIIAKFPAAVGCIWQGGDPPC